MLTKAQINKRLAKILYDRQIVLARLRKLDWELSFTDWLVLSKSICYLCGARPKNRFTRQDHKSYAGGLFIYQGIDRVDNKLGYVNGNVMPCCWLCNAIKRDLSFSNFKRHILAIVSNGSLFKKAGFRGIKKT